MTRRTAGVWPVLVVLAAVVSTTCSSERASLPTAPSPPPAQPPAPAPPPAPPAPTPPPPRGSLEAEVVPNPVPYSGQPITDVAGCANAPNTWFYDQILRETGGAEVRITHRVDSFNRREVNNRSDLNIIVPANGSTTLRTRWCSASAGPHTAQSRFSGKDASGIDISVTAPEANLSAK